MASLISKRNIIYISYYDAVKHGSKLLSTKMINTPANWKKAEKLKKEFEIELKKQAKEFSSRKIKINSIGSCFDHFLKNNSDKNIKTIKDYHRFYNKFTEFFPPQMPAVSLNKRNVENFLIEIKKLNQKKNSIYCYFKQLRHFLNFLFEYNYTPQFIINKDVRPKQETVEKIVFEAPDIEKIFSNLSDKSRNFRLMLYLAYYTGLRSSDLLSIEREDINLKQKTFKYYSPKRKRYREIPFHNDLLPVLKKELEEKPEGKLIEYAKTENMQQAFRKYLKSIDLDGKNYVMRTFRKTFITFGYGLKMYPSIVEELVGHEHQTITGRHYNLISLASMREELLKLPAPLKTVEVFADSSNLIDTSFFDIFFRSTENIALLDSLKVLDMHTVTPNIIKIRPSSPRPSLTSLQQ